MLVATWETMPEGIGEISLPVWLALGYVSLFSMLIGFIFWYQNTRARQATFSDDEEDTTSCRVYNDELAGNSCVRT